MIAYNTQELEKLELVNESEKWFKAGIIDSEQWEIIQTEYFSNLYHPPFWLRVILFLATIVGVYSSIGLFASIIFSGFDGIEEIIRVILTIIGIGSFILLELVAIKNKNHYKSGVSEALLFMGFSNIIHGLVGYDFNEYLYAFLVFTAGLIAAVRYLNLIGIVAAVGAVAFLVFQGLYDLGGYFEAIIPFAFILVFGTGYFLSQLFQKQKELPFYKDSFIVLDTLLLALVYAGGNYFVVRELSIEMMGLEIGEGEDIPFGWLFHITTVIIPVTYLYFGIKRKELHLIRIGILSVFASVITFKYYYSLGHPEISLTIAGAITAGLTIWMFNYLKTIKNGFTREKLLTDKWDNINAESVLISSTMGGNVAPEKTETEFGGGEFGGGGAGGEY